MTSLTRIQPEYVATLEQTAGNEWVDLVQPAADLAAMIAQTEFVPAEMRNKPAAIAACILYGAEIGIGPMQSLAKVDIVKGRPAPRAELARALALAAGHEIWVEEQSNTRCKVSGRRRGSQQVQTVTWTLDDVKKAGIANQAYGKYPRQMLLARASAELVRMMCPDVLGGIGLFAEEAVDATDNTTPVVAAAPEPKTTTTRKRPAPAPALAPAPITEEIPLLPDELPTTDTTAQNRKMMAAFNELGLPDRADRLAFVAAVVRPVESSNDLTPDERSQVIDAIQQAIDGRLNITWTDPGVLTVEPVERD